MAAIVCCILLLDLGTKALVSGSFGLNENHQLLSFLSIVPTHNPGVSLTFIDGGFHLPVYVLVGVMLAGATIIAVHPPLPLLWVSAGLILGGALGNLLELLHHGYATDFIHVHGTQQVFNFADLSLISGLIFLLAVSTWGRLELTASDVSSPSSPD
jgi:signal peptidase II